LGDSARLSARPRSGHRLGPRGSLPISFPGAHQLPDGLTSHTGGGLHRHTQYERMTTVEPTSRECPCAVRSVDMGQVAVFMMCFSPRARQIPARSTSPAARGALQDGRPARRGRSPSALASRLLVPRRRPGVPPSSTTWFTGTSAVQEAAMAHSRLPSRLWSRDRASVPQPRPFAVTVVATRRASHRASAGR
jgi:hypothetical protein